MQHDPSSSDTKAAEDTRNHRVYNGYLMVAIGLLLPHFLNSLLKVTDPETAAHAAVEVVGCLVVLLGSVIASKGVLNTFMRAILITTVSVACLLKGIIAILMLV